MTRPARLDRRQHQHHAPLTENKQSRGDEAPVGVDYQPNEREQAERPIRPPGWKAKEVPLRKLAIRVNPQKGFEPRIETSGTAPMRVTIARTRQPPESLSEHVERKQLTNAIEAEIDFIAVPPGDYLIICQPKGYRPFVRRIHLTGEDAQIELGARLEPVRFPEEEEVLVRFGESSPYVDKSRRFLSRFGYLPAGGSYSSPELDQPVSAALRNFQQFYHLRPTGTLTVETLLLMLRPRCAVPDVLHDTPLRSSAGPPGVNAGDPISFMGNRWDTFALRYRQFDGTSDITNEWTLIKAGMNRWGAVTPLSFSQVTSGSSDLEFDFRRPSESGYPFDEGGDDDGNVYAHAWGPTNGLVEFDDYEDWGSTDLPGTATHEIGHALGLAHSSVEDATMYAYIHDGSATLHEVDVRGIKSLYPPVYRHSGPFVAYPLWAFKNRMGTDTVTIDLGAIRHFLAWGTITMIDSLLDLDRDNMSFIDIYEVDGLRTNFRISGGAHFGSATSPGNAYEGAVVRYGRRITFRITAGHSEDLEVAGYAIVLVLT